MDTRPVNRWLSKSEIVTRYGISPRTFERWLKTKRFPTADFRLHGGSPAGRTRPSRRMNATLLARKEPPRSKRPRRKWRGRLFSTGRGETVDAADF